MSTLKVNKLTNVAGDDTTGVEIDVPLKLKLNENIPSTDSDYGLLYCKDSTLYFVSETGIEFALAGGTTTSFTGNLSFTTDGSLIKFGADEDVSLTHVHDTGLLLNTASKLQFREASQYINSDADDDLTIAAQAEIDFDIASSNKLKITSSGVAMGALAPDSTLLKKWYETKSVATASGSTLAIDLSLGSIFTTTLSTNKSIFTITNVEIGSSFTWIAQQASGSDYNLTYSTTTVNGASKDILWNGGIVPSIGTDNNSYTILTFFYDGTSLFGMVGGRNFKTA